MKVEISNVKGEVIRTISDVSGLRFDGGNLFHIVVDDKTHLVPSTHFFVNTVSDEVEKEEK